MSSHVTIPTDATDATDSIDAAQARAYTRASNELAVALRRYSAMSAVPRHLQFPIVGDIRAVERAVANARARGHQSRADEMQRWLDREDERIERLAEFQLAGRTSTAWLAVADRLRSAIANALTFGVLVAGSDYEISASDRERDARLQGRLARREECPLFS